jgi:hopanoid biosynthesis associated protein HpnK
MKQLIINGDDFGVSPSVNQAIIQAHQQGILTSTSLMVTGSAFQEAVALAKQNPRLGVGLHLTLVCGRSQLSPKEIPHLVNQQGNFLNDPVQAGLRYQFHPQARQELRQEIHAQLQAFQATGLKLSHVDGHLHLHTHPVILGILKELAPEFAIPFIRLPYEELNFTLKISPHNSWLKFIQSQIFTQLRHHGETLFAQTPVRFCDRVYGLLQTGQIDESYLLQLLPQIQANLVEIYAHPDTESHQINPAGPLELEALLSPKVRDRLEQEGFQLVNYHQVKLPSQSP